MKRFLDKTWWLLGSYHLAVGVVVLLTALTWLGTLEQRYRAIEDVQEDYFESLIVVSRTLGASEADPQGGFPVPLPGAYLLLAVLLVNLIVGGMIRMRKTRRTVGIMIIHVGVAMLLVAGFIEFQSSTKGYLEVDEGESQDYYESYYDWDLIITEYRTPRGTSLPEMPTRGEEPAFTTREFTVPFKHWAHEGETIRFTHEGLPFDVVTRGYQRNAETRADPGGGGKHGGIGGVLLVGLPEDTKQAERNMPGVLLHLEGKGAEKGRTLGKSILWAFQRAPSRFEFDSASGGAAIYGAHLRRTRYPLPFALRLTKGVRKDHPGTRRPAEYSSYIEKLEDGVTQDIHITMNAPLRHRGFTFFQSTMQSPNLEQDYYTSGFSVVQNPADIVPEISWWIIGLGLLIHFGLKLWLYIGSESRRRAQTEVRHAS